MNARIENGRFQRDRRRDLLKAGGIIVLLFILVFLIEGIYTRSFSPEKTTSSYQSQISLETIMSGSDLPAQDMQGEFPFGFEEEVLNLADCSDLYVSESGKVVSFISTINAEEQFNICSEKLCARGWTRVESGHATAASFVKTKGIFNWVFLECIPVGNESSVLIQTN